MAFWVGSVFLGFSFSHFSFLCFFQLGAGRKQRRMRTGMGYGDRVDFLSPHPTVLSPTKRTKLVFEVLAFHVSLRSGVWFCLLQLGAGGL